MSTKIEVIEGVLHLSRRFEAPPELVFAAWTEPEMVCVWWGCDRTESVESTVDLRVGGEYRHVMQLREAGEVVFVGHFTEVDPPSRLAYTAKGGPVEGMPDLPDTTTNVEFEGDGGGTLLRMRIEGLSGTPYEGIVTGGWQAGLQKLAAQILSLSA